MFEIYQVIRKLGQTRLNIKDVFIELCK